MVFVDRPLALWVDEHFRGTAAYRASDLMFRTLDGLAVVGLVLFIAASAVTLMQPRVPDWITRFAWAGAAGVATLTVTMLLKVTFGRSQVYPPFLKQHIYTFHLFGGSKDYDAFPSATMSVVSAFLTGLVLERASQRVIAALVLVGLAVALLVVNGHWLADIIGGAYVGIVVGTLTFQRRPARVAETPNVD
jgi:membrane-associated phospholipid phosphatase